MKKQAAAGLLVLICARGAGAEAFTPGTLVVLRLGATSGTLPGAGVAVSQYLDEYDVSGASAVKLQTIAIPDSGPTAATLLNELHRDGVLQRSQDGRYLTLGGYGADTGSTSSFIDSAKVAVRVGWDGTVDTSTRFSNTHSGNPIRSVASKDGSGFYISADGSNSISYIGAGSTSGTVIQSGAWRGVAVANDQLYAFSGSSQQRGISTVGVGLPTTGGQGFTTITPSPNPATGPGVSAITFAGPDVIYAAGSALVNNGDAIDDFRRYSRVDGGSFRLDSVTSGGSGIGSPEGGSSAYGVVAYPDPLGGNDVYLSTYAGIYKVVDSNPLNSRFSTLTMTRIIDAPENTVFRGLAASPFLSVVSGTYWAPQGPSGGGNGVWSASSKVWASGAGSQGSGSQGAGLLHFAGAAGTVTIDGTVQADSGLSFETTGYVLTAGNSSPQLTLTGATAAGNLISVADGAVATISSRVVSSNGMTKGGNGTLVLKNGLSDYGPGMVLNAGAVEFASSQTVKSLTVNSGTVAKIKTDVANVRNVLKIGDNVNTAPLSFNGSGKLDLVSGGVAVDFPVAGDGQMSLVRNRIRGSGASIVSTTAGLNPAGFGIGYAFAKEVLPFANNAASDVFMGTAVDQSTIVARYTLLGDANLDGVVDFNDLVRLAQNYNTPVSGTTQSWWYSGDFTGDGFTDFNDLVKLAQNYNSGLPLGAEIADLQGGGGLAGASTEFNNAWQAAVSSVPEPGCLGVLACCALGLRRRRR